MVDGSHPDTSRAFVPPKQGWSTSQPTHTSAAFTPDMVAGWHPDSAAKIFLGPKLGWSISQPTHTSAPFTPDMAFGWRPDRAVLSKPRPDGWLTSQLTFDAFSIEMAQGWQPLRAVLGKPAPRDWSIAQTTHVAAPFGIEMVNGWKPDQPRLILKPRIGWQDSQLTFDVPMTAEMFAGWHPDRARLMLGPKIALPDSQLTHIAAPFGVEMIRGWQPAKGILLKPAPHGWISNQTTFAIFSNEMVIGWQPQRGQLKKPFPHGWIISQPTHVNAPFSVEMVAGSHPDRRRPDARELLWSREIPWLGGAILFVAPQRVSTASLTSLDADVRHTMNAILERSLTGASTRRDIAGVPIALSVIWLQGGWIQDDL